MRRGFFLFVFCFWLPSAASADQIETREELMLLIGDSAVTDDFETFAIGDHQYLNTGLSYLDASTTSVGRGPSLVHPGADYSFLRGPLTWMGGGYNGMLSRTIVCWSPDGSMDAVRGVEEVSQSFEPALFFAIQIIYKDPVEAFGIDLLRFDEVGLVTVELYDRLERLIQEFDISIPDVGPPTFFGYYHPAGISSVVVKNTRFPTFWSPNLDNHTYGRVQAVPTAKTSLGKVKRHYR